MTREAQLYHPFLSSSHLSTVDLCFITTHAQYKSALVTSFIKYHHSSQLGAKWDDTEKLQSAVQVMYLCAVQRIIITQVLIHR